MLSFYSPNLRSSLQSNSHSALHRIHIETFGNKGQSLPIRRGRMKKFESKWADDVETEREYNADVKLVDKKCSGKRRFGINYHWKLKTDIRNQQVAGNCCFFVSILFSSTNFFFPPLLFETYSHLKLVAYFSTSTNLQFKSSWRVDLDYDDDEPTLQKRKNIIFIFSYTS